MKKISKKFLALILCAMLLMVFAAGCWGNNDNNVTPSPTAASPNPTQNPATTTPNATVTPNSGVTEENGGVNGNNVNGGTGTDVVNPDGTTGEEGTVLPNGNEDPVESAVALAEGMYGVEDAMVINSSANEYVIALKMTDGATLSEEQITKLQQSISGAKEVRVTTDETHYTRVQGFNGTWDDNIFKEIWDDITK